MDDWKRHPTPNWRPMGPLWYRVRALRPTRTRVLAGLMLAACVGAMAMAAWLEPDPAGYGTHSQLGLSACGMMTTTGLPCPTCGMTTAFALAIRGRWLEALHAQIAGSLLFVAVAMTAALSAVVLVTGRVWMVNWFRVSAARLVLALSGILLLAWVIKIQLVR